LFDNAVRILRAKKRRDYVQRYFDGCNGFALKKVDETCDMLGFVYKKVVAAMLALYAIRERVQDLSVQTTTRMQAAQNFHEDVDAAVLVGKQIPHKFIGSAILFLQLMKDRDATFHGLSYTSSLFFRVLQRLLAEDTHFLLQSSQCRTVNFSDNLGVTNQVHLL
jgi:hypothetical protein